MSQVTYVDPGYSACIIFEEARIFEITKVKKANQLKRQRCGNTVKQTNLKRKGTGEGHGEFYIGLPLKVSPINVLPNTPRKQSRTMPSGPSKVVNNLPAGERRAHRQATLSTARATGQ
jgi:hypothetical protein